MRWGCHSFGEIHAIFSYHGSNSDIETRLKIIWRALTTKGIVGFVYAPSTGVSKYLESKIETMANYGIVHGSKNFEQHIYYRNEDEPLQDEVREKLESDLMFYEKRQEIIRNWYDWNSKQVQLALDATKCRLDSYSPSEEGD